MAENRAVPNVSPDVLSPTELRVAKLLTAGYSLDGVAAVMNCTRGTVDGHCDAICEKLGVHDLFSLVRWAKLYDVGKW